VHAFPSKEKWLLSSYSDLCRKIDKRGAERTNECARVERKLKAGLLPFS
jgi:hypothetical protein